MSYHTMNDYQFFAFKIKLNKRCGVIMTNTHYIWSEYEGIMWRSLENIHLAVLSKFKTTPTQSFNRLIIGVGWDLFIK